MKTKLFALIISIALSAAAFAEDTGTMGSGNRSGGGQGMGSGNDAGEDTGTIGSGNYIAEGGHTYGGGLAVSETADYTILHVYHPDTMLYDFVIVMTGAASGPRPLQ